jgi:hypothetical protein
VSADNYIVIFHDPDGKFRGYMGFMSDIVPDEALRDHQPRFEVDTREAAEDESDRQQCEYGFYFYDRAASEREADERYRAWRQEAWHLATRLRRLRGQAPADVAGVMKVLEDEAKVATAVKAVTR